MKLSELLYPNEYTSVHSTDDIDITEIVSDTSLLSPGCLFVCIRGTKHDTHQAIPYIARCGTSAIIVEKGCDICPCDVPIFTVNNTRATLAHLWNRFCGDVASQFCFIGVTGTNGKTSTAYMTHTALVANGYCCGFIGTVQCMINHEIFTPTLSALQYSRLSTMTTPDPDILYSILLQMKQRGVTHIVMEVSSHALLFSKCAPILFDIGLFTNLSPEHLDIHENMEAYLQAKMILFGQCKTGIVNIDDPYARLIIERASCEMLTCSTQNEACFSAIKIVEKGTMGVDYIFCSSQGRCALSLQTPGHFTIYNSLLAAAAALTAGASLSKIKKGLGELRGVKGRMERVNGEDIDFSVFIDYAHTEMAMRHLLTTVRSFCKKGERIVALFGCGGDRDKTKREKMGACAAELADYSIITTDNCRTEDAKQIILDILKGMPNPQRRKVIVSRAKAIEYAILHAQPNDVILLIGKGHEAYEIIGTKQYDFDEREIVRQAIQKRKWLHNHKEGDYEG